MSSFGSLPRAASLAALEGAGGSGGRTPAQEGAMMSKVESIASTAVRAAAKMDVRRPPLIFLRLHP